MFIVLIQIMNGILTWDDLNKFKVEDLDRVHGINNSYANLRLFGHSENDVLVTLYRDCLLYTSPSPRDREKSRMPSSA